MGSTILILGDGNSDIIKDKILSLVNDFLDINLKYEDLDSRDFIKTISKIDDKITVEMVSNYQEFFNLTQEKKIGIFYDFDYVSVIGQNKLLKMIEDNKDNTMQIFIASNESSILTTIKSRLVSIDLRKQSQVNFSGDSILYDEVITEVGQYNYLNDNEKIKAALETIYKHLVNCEYNLAFVIFSKDIFTGVDTIVYEIMFRMIVISLKNNNKIKLAQEVIALERRVYMNLDVNLQIQAILIKISKG